MIAPIRWRRLAAEWWIVALVTSAAVVFLVHDRATERLDRLAYDFLLQFDAHAPDPRILVAAIDDRSTREIGPWPWPRAVQAELLDKLAAARPGAIAYDVLLTVSRPGDERLGAALAGPTPIFIPLFMRAPGANGAPFDVVPPVPAARAAADGTGHVNLIVDSDGSVRRVRLVAGDERGRWPHLMELMRRAAAGTPGRAADEDPYLIPFSGPAGHFPTVSASSVIRGEVPPELLRDRLIVVGVTAEGLGDRYATAGGNRAGVMPGVEVQAHLLDGLLSGKMIREGSALARAFFALVPLWILLVALRRARPGAIFALLAALVPATLAASAAALLQARLWLTPVPALVGLAVVYPLWGWRRLAAVNGYMTEELERFRAEPEVLAAAPAAPAPNTDPVSHRISLLNDAIARARDLRRFVADSLRQLPDGLFVTDTRGRIVLANAQAEALLEALQMQSVEQDMSALFGRLRRADAGEEGHSLPEAGDPLSWAPEDGIQQPRALSPAGECFDIRVVPRRSADGLALGWIVRTINVTAAWKAQRQREEMLQFLSHDVRSPQASVLTILAEAKDGPVTPAMASRIEGHVRRTIELADGFIRLARAETLRFDPEPVDLCDVLVDALDDVWPRIMAKGMLVRETRECETLLVPGERSLLTRAVINLLDNAVRHSPRDGQLTCRLARIEDREMEMATCAIGDQGPGIEPDQLATLFERFQQAPGNRGIGEGVGLGLSLVHTVARRHGGWIRYESPGGEGAMFILGLPLAEEVKTSPERADR